MRIKIISYNIHKGFTVYNLKFVLEKIRDVLRTFDPDLALLQEVIGHHTHHRREIEEWETNAQFEYLADSYWEHFSYGKNAVYTQGHHGNAVLSKYPILEDHNEDLTLHKYEQRGLLHTKIRDPEKDITFHALTTHINLLGFDRKKQVTMIVRYIRDNIPAKAPLLLAGDFNDWRKKITPLLEDHLGLKEAFYEDQNRHAKTWPSFFPLFSLDRIYYRNMEVCDSATFCHKTWKGLSDHLGIMAEFQIK